MFFGNTFVFIQFYGLEKIDFETRKTVFWYLTGSALLGVICMLGFKSNEVSTNDTDNESQVIKITPTKALQKAFQMFRTKHMMLLSLSSVYSGIVFGGKKVSIFQGRKHKYLKTE